MTIPSPWTFALLTLASFYVFYLVSEAKVFDHPRAWLLGYSGWSKGQTLPDTFRAGLSDFIDCPWCLGFWLTLVLWGAYEVWPHQVTVACVPLAVASVMALLTLIHRLIAQYLED